jgi:hypothetical protein
MVCILLPSHLLWQVSAEPARLRADRPFGLHNRPSAAVHRHATPVHIIQPVPAASPARSDAGPVVFVSMAVVAHYRLLQQEYLRQQQDWMMQQQQQQQQEMLAAQQAQAQQEEWMRQQMLLQQQQQQQQQFAMMQAQQQQQQQLMAQPTGFGYVLVTAGPLSSPHACHLDQTTLSRRQDQPSRPRRCRRRTSTASTCKEHIRTVASRHLSPCRLLSVPRATI